MGMKIMVTTIKLCFAFIRDAAWYWGKCFGLRSAIELARVQMKQRKKKMSIDDAAAQGAMAFQKNKCLGDNPFDLDSQRELFNAWRDGFINEKQWWGK